MQIVLDQVTKEYHGKTALRRISTELPGGQLIGMIGKNGAGKTTLLKLLATILKPTGGRILLDGTDIVKTPSAMRRLVGYLPQDVAVYPNLTAFEYLNYIACIKGLKRADGLRQIEDLLEQFHLTDVKEQRLGGFSGGMKQRVGMICALLGEPKVIIADEPSAGLDPEERIAIRNILSELSRERLVILSTHIVSDIEAAASRILVLRQGDLIYDGTPGGLISNVKGYVWEYTTPALQGKPKGVSSMVQTENGFFIRQVSRHKPAEQAVPAEGTLEDACLLALEE